MPQIMCANPDCQAFGLFDTKGGKRYCCDACKSHAAYLRKRFLKRNRVRPILRHCAFCNAPFYDAPDGYQYCSMYCLGEAIREGVFQDGLSNV